MKITDVETIFLSVDRSLDGKPLKLSWAISRVHTDKDIVGIGRGGSSITQEHLKPILVGEDPLNVERIWWRMYQVACRFRGPGRSALGAIGTVDVAIWDIIGKAMGQPVYKLLGGFRDRVRAYADGGMYFSKVEDVAGRVAEYVRQGFKDVKIHLLGDTPEMVIEKVKSSREAAGDDVNLMVDALRLWDPLTAIEIMKELEKYNLYWIEEPIRWDDEVRGMAMLASAIKTPVAAGESECTLYGCRELIANGGVRIIQADTVGAGGFTQLRKIAALAGAYHVLVAPHGASYPEICAHLVAAVPNGLIVSAFPSMEPYQIWSDLYREPLGIKGGWIEMPQRPGLGMELDESFIEKHRVEPKPYQEE